MQKSVDVAVLGATGEVGRSMLSVLSERNFPIGKLYPLASHGGGRTVNYGDKSLEVIRADQFDFSTVQIVLASAGNESSAEFVPKALAAGASVVDNSPVFRLTEKSATVVPEINGEELAQRPAPMIVSCPNCASIPLVLSLAPLNEEWGLERVIVSTYQSVSGAGHTGVHALSEETRQLFSGQDSANEEEGSDAFEKTIAFNVIPRIGSFDANGYTGEEMKVINETRHLLSLPQLPISATCVRVGVFYGHSESVSVFLKESTTVEKVRAAFVKAKGLQVIDQPDRLLYPTPLEHGSGTDDTYIGRIRMDTESDKIVHFWLVCDNIRKGAALNSVQIAEVLLDRI